MCAASVGTAHPSFDDAKCSRGGAGQSLIKLAEPSSKLIVGLKDKRLRPLTMNSNCHAQDRTVTHVSHPGNIHSHE